MLDIMGKARYIYFDDGVSDWLNKQPKGSMSKLINDLLKEHMKNTELDYMDLEQLKIELEIAKEEKQSKLRKEAIRNGQKQPDNKQDS
tara:strand:- start:201 stop:464 length:264 start_codon:yes stop_codon:yes gene_type:complete